MVDKMKTKDIIIGAVAGVVLTKVFDNIMSGNKTLADPLGFFKQLTSNLGLGNVPSRGIQASSIYNENTAPVIEKLQQTYGNLTSSTPVAPNILSETYGKWNVERGIGAAAPVVNPTYIQSGGKDAGSAVRVVGSQGRYIEERYTPPGANRSFLRVVDNPSWGGAVSRGGTGQRLTTAQKQLLENP